MDTVRDAARSLRATPVVTLMAILSLVFGIGANTAIFSIVDGLYLRSLPVEDPGQLVMLRAADGRRRFWSNPMWEQIRARESLFDGAFAWGAARLNLAPRGETEVVDGLWVSGRMFDVLGVPAVLGRTIGEGDDRRGGGPDGPVAVISYGFWQRRFNGAADVIGRTLTVERVPFTIVGVTPPRFFGVEAGRTFDVAIPIGTEPLVYGAASSLDGRSSGWLNMMVRLKSSQSAGAGEAALRGVLPQIREATIPPELGQAARDSFLAEGFALVAAATDGFGLRDRYRQPLTTIMVVVALVLLIACANVANLLLARATARRQELSIRVALGASRLRIARQLLTESLMLSAIGSIGGLAVAQWGSRVLMRQFATSAGNVFLPLTIDWRILGFTAAVAIVTAVLFGMAPALRGMRVDSNDALNARGRGSAAETRFGMGNLLVVGQVALSVVLVVAAGLFLRTFATLATRDVGFDRDPVLIATINTLPARLEPAARAELFRRALDAARVMPGAESVALSAVTPVSGNAASTRIEIDGPSLPERDRIVSFHRVSPEWFRTYRTSLLAGRDFNGDDRRDTPQVAIVNETFVRRFLSGRNPIGVRVRQAQSGRPFVEREIVGFVKDAAYRDLREPTPPTLYIPYLQQPEAPQIMSLSVRAASASPGLLARPLAGALTQLHGDVTITVTRLADQVNASLAQERIVAWLSGFFGALALLLAALGLYGVTSYAVNRRRTEIGIRMALGAAPGRVVALVFRRAAVLVGLGMVAGAAASLWAMQFVAALLYGLQPRDPLTLAAAIIVLAAVGAAAAWLPARRASRIDPMCVLRET
jgi:putative ABC transport system permease protein